MAVWRAATRKEKKIYDVEGQAFNLAGLLSDGDLHYESEGNVADTDTVPQVILSRLSKMVLSGTKFQTKMQTRSISVVRCTKGKCLKIVGP